MAERWKVGDRIKGKYDEYEVYRILGGGMGIVYVCYAIKQQLPVVLKTFHEKFFASKEHQEMFRREALIWTELERYPYIVRAYFVEEVSGRLFIVLEFVAPDEEGKNTLTHYLEGLSLSDSLRFAVQFCYGMEYAYSKGVKVHRDIKPDNIMITQDKIVKITDFGLATIFDRPEIRENAEFGMQNAKWSLSVFKTERGRVTGTPSYMAPEQFEGKTDRRSDIYAFGVVLYQMASGGRLPFVGRTWEEYYMLHRSGRIPYIDSPLFPIIERCMRRRSPKFDSFASLQEELEKLLYQETGEKIQPPKVEELEAWELSNKGLSLADLGKLNEAITCYDKALEINPRFVEAWNNKALALADLGKINEAITCYDKALEINSGFALAWNNKGTALADLGRLNEAIICYDKALEINPGNALAWNNKGIVLANLGRIDEEITCYDKALEINPGDALAWSNKGMALGALGRMEEAVLCFERALSLNPRAAQVWVNKGIFLGTLGRFKEAIDCFNYALEINPQFGKAWAHKGAVLVKLGKQDEEALKCFNQALKLDSQDATAAMNKGVLLQRAGHKSLAEEYFDRALDNRFVAEAETVDSLVTLLSQTGALTAEQKVERIIGMFNNLCLQIGKHRELDDMLETTMKYTRDLIPTAECGVIVLKPPNEEKLLIKAQTPKGVARYSKTFVELAMRTGKAFIYPRERTVDHKSQIPNSLIRNQIKALACAPFIWHEKSLGAIFLYTTKEEQFFTSEDINHLVSIANHVAAAIAAHWLQEELEYERRKASYLGVQFSPQVYKQLIQKRGKPQLGGDLSEIVILCADIRGFTKLTTGKHPDDIVEMLNEYFSEWVDVIFEYEGTVDKFIGDAILAVFGSPNPDKDKYAHAVKAAIKMQQVTKAIADSKQRRLRGLICEIGIGIHSGEALHGFIGSPERMEFTVIGEAVNMASRLCDCAQPGEILISPQLYSREEVFWLVKVERIERKTKHEGIIEAYRVIGLFDDDFGEII